MTPELRFQREGAQTIKVGIIDGTDNKELRHLTRMGTILKQKIPFKFEIISEPTVAIRNGGENKHGSPCVELCVRPTAINILVAMGELKAKHFIPGFETT